MFKIFIVCAWASLAVFAQEMPFDEKLIIFEMLNKKERKWLTDYQNKALR